MLGWYFGWLMWQQVNNGQEKETSDDDELFFRWFSDVQVRKQTTKLDENTVG